MKNEGFLGPTLPRPQVHHKIGVFLIFKIKEIIENNTNKYVCASKMKKCLSRLEGARLPHITTHTPMTRRAYSRIGYRVIRGQGELVATQKVNDKYCNFGCIFDRSSDPARSHELSVFLPAGWIIDTIYFTKQDSILLVWRCKNHSSRSQNMTHLKWDTKKIEKWRIFRPSPHQTTGSSQNLCFSYFQNSVSYTHLTLPTILLV